MCEDTPETFDPRGAGREPPLIPEELHSAYEEGPFRVCSVCSAVLDELGTPYAVEKVYRGTETIIEFAICMGCMENVRQDLSEESREFMENYVAKKLPTATSDACLDCGAGRDEVVAYKLSGVCYRRWLIAPRMVMMCEPCAMKMQEGLSRRTRERLGDFRNDVLDLFPDELVIEPLTL
jgi:hypothetical protein